MNVTYLDKPKKDDSKVEIAPSGIGGYYVKNPSAEYATVNPSYVVASVEES